MIKLDRVRVGSRIALAFAGVFLLMLSSGLAVLLAQNQVRREAEELLGSNAQRVELAYEWREAMTANASRAVIVGLMSDPTLNASIRDKIASTSAEIVKIQQRLALLERSADGADILNALQAVRTRYQAAREELLKPVEGGSSIAAAVARGQSMRAFQAANDEYLRAVSRLVDYEKGRSQVLGSRILSAVGLAGSIALACSLLCAVVCLLSAWFLTRSIVKPVEQAQSAADRIASGDLSRLCEARGGDEIALLVRSIAKMQQALLGIVRQIRASSESMQLASAEVASGNQDLSLRTEQTAGDLQRAASSMHQLEGMVQQGADSASQAHALAEAASQMAASGGQVVEQVVATMEAITASSKRISEITGVIDGIAFQTNILALNAAVEAARAGEQGRGFAVVAGEVRSLAQRSAEAAREIKTLIGTSVSRVHDGERLVHETGQVMRRIVSSVGEVRRVVAEVTNAADQQARSIRSVVQAVNSVDQMTQQNAALVEQSAAAAESMSEQALRLTRTVEQFRA